MTPSRFRFADTANSLESSTLASAGTFTGEWHDFNDAPFKATLVSANSTASGTLYMEYSNDGINVRSSLSFQVVANIREVHKLENSSRYYRTRFVNGSSSATVSIETNFGDFEALTAPMNLSLGLDSDALPTRPSITQDEIRIGRRAGVRGFTKFGHTNSLTAAAGEEVVWPISAAFTPLTSASTFTITYTPASDGATSNGAKTLFFDYIDASGLPVQTTHTLGSSGSDVTSFTGLGINRVAVSSSGSTQTNGAAITITATTGGSTQAYIDPGSGVTQQCILFIGSNHDAVGKFLWINVNRVGGGSNPVVLIKGYVFNRAIATRFEVLRLRIDTAVDNFVQIIEPIGFNFSPSDVFWLVADTDTNGTVVNGRFSINEYQRT